MRIKRPSSSFAFLPLVVGFGYAASLSYGCSNTGSATTPAPTAANPNTIPIAMVLSLSGPAASLGAEAKRGAEVAVAQINSLGGILGKEIDLQVSDDTSVPSVARDKINEFADKGITLGIGPSTSDAALAVKDLILGDKIVYVSPSATSPDLDSLNGPDAAGPTVLPPHTAPANPVFFRTAATDVLLADALTLYASSGTAVLCPNIVIVEQNDSYGKPIGDLVKRYYVRDTHGVANTINIDADTTVTANLDGAALAAANATVSGNGKPADCQIVIAQPDIAAAYMHSFKNLVSTKPTLRDWSTFLTIGSDGFRQDEFIVKTRSDPADLVDPTAGEGAFAVAADTSPVTEPAYNAFLHLFKARFPNDDPGRYSSTAYDAMMLLAGAIVKAGGTDNHKSVRDSLYFVSQGRVAVSPEKISDLFSKLTAGGDVNYEGASGSVDFSPDGHVASAFGVWKVVKQTFVPQVTFKASELAVIQ